MFPPIYATLAADYTVTSIIGSSPSRVYRHGSAPQNVSRPYVTWAIVSGLPDNNLSEEPPSDRITLQIDAWSPDDAQAEELAIAVRDAIEPEAHMTGIVVNTQDAETRLFRVGLQFDWIMHRPGSSPESESSSEP